MSHSLQKHLRAGIYEAKKEYDVLLIVIVIIIHAGICAVYSSFNFTIMKYLGENNKSEVLKWIIYSALLDCVREYVYYLYSILYQSRIQLAFKQHLLEKYLTWLLLEANHDWLHCNKPTEINTAINSGTDALMKTLRFSIDVLFSRNSFNANGDNPIVSLSTSTNIGFAPQYLIALQVATKVSG